MLASNFGHTEVVQALLADARVDTNIKGKVRECMLLRLFAASCADYICSMGRQLWTWPGRIKVLRSSHCSRQNWSASGGCGDER